MMFTTTARLMNINICVIREEAKGVRGQIEREKERKRDREGAE